MILKNILGREFDLNKLGEETFLQDSRNYSELITKQINEGLYNFVGHLVSKESVVLDFGGNIGYFSFFVAPIAKEVHSYEPTPETFRVLKKFKETGNLENVVIHNKAVSNQDGKMNFYVYNHNRTMNSLREIQGLPEYMKTSIEVEVVSLSSILEQFEQVDLVKIDIEGGEKFILDDQQFSQNMKKIKNLFIEIHDIQVYENEPTPRWMTNFEFNVLRIGQRLVEEGFVVDRVSYDGLLARKP